MQVPLPHKHTLPSVLRMSTLRTSATDPATLQRVITALLAQLGGTLPAADPHAGPGSAGQAAPHLERRTFTPLSHGRAGARR